MKNHLFRLILLSLVFFNLTTYAAAEEEQWKSISVIPPIQEQIEEYRTIYKPYAQPNEMYPRTLHINELWPKVELSTQYAYRAIKGNPEKEDLLNIFFSKIKKKYVDHQLTMRTFLGWNIQLGFLITSDPKRCLEEELFEDKKFIDLCKSEKWKNLEEFENLYSVFGIEEDPTILFPYAVLYLPTAELEISDFLDNWFVSSLALHLIVLPYDPPIENPTSLGPHGGVYNCSNIFPIHDWLHSLFLDSISPQRWRYLREKFTSIYTNDLCLFSKKKTEIFLFLLFHETNWKLEPSQDRTKWNEYNTIIFERFNFGKNLFNEFSRLIMMVYGNIEDELDYLLSWITRTLNSRIKHFLTSELSDSVNIEVKTSEILPPIIRTTFQLTWEPDKEPQTLPYSERMIEVEADLEETPTEVLNQPLITLRINKLTNIDSTTVAVDSHPIFQNFFDTAMHPLRGKSLQREYDIFRRDYVKLLSIAGCTLEEKSGESTDTTVLEGFLQEIFDQYSHLFSPEEGSFPLNTPLPEESTKE